MMLLRKRKIRSFNQSVISLKVSGFRSVEVGHYTEEEEDDLSPCAVLYCAVLCYVLLWCAVLC